MAKKRPFSDYFKRYDKPQWRYDASQGHGSVKEWQSAWEQRMGADEAVKRVGNDNPLTLLGLDKLPASLDDLRRHYKRVMLKHAAAFQLHASEADQEKAKQLIAAFTVLEGRFQ